VARREGAAWETQHAFKARLAPLCADYRRLWLARSRYGGLQESYQKLKSLADDLSKSSGYCGSGYRGFGGFKPDLVVGNARHPELQPYLVLSASGEWELQYGEGLFSAYAPNPSH